MIIRKSIDVPSWDEQTILKARQYWEERGFTLKAEDATTFSGRRGSWWGTLGAAGCSQVLTDLRIGFDGSRLDCSIEIDTRLRAITLWHRKQLELELATLESILLTGDHQPEAWARHRKESKNALQDALSDNFGHLFRSRKPDRPMQIGGDLIFKMWTFIVLGAGASIGFFLWGDGLFTSSLMMSHSKSGRHYVMPGFGAIAGIFMAAMFAAMAAWLYQLRRQGQTCVGVDQAALKLGMDSQVLQRAIEQRGIKAKFILDGEFVYDLEDITGAATLLRPAEEVTDATLLKPAAKHDSESRDVLIRAANQVNIDDSEDTVSLRR